MLQLTTPRKWFESLQVVCMALALCPQEQSVQRSREMELGCVEAAGCCAWLLELRLCIIVV